ncbi:polysaccharide biosynthesis C-terminal domain-containing protein [uncultured Chitinophaga sp.]|uniref:oligosaccharide flippase family protein n=1 Tax=uncultured Chitinophaga sp. TaxID=339340 RepID=UPI0025FF471E|nr:polysaccharide biosynthesis C-terminal domain-containing protein [uncultured Chitinophaga sp.]
MSSIKRLAGQTLIYGVPTILGRFLNVLISFGLTYLFNSTADFGDYALVYAYATFLNVLFTYGTETSYFRFAQMDQFRNDVYSTTLSSLVATSVLFSSAMILASGWIADFMKLSLHPEYVIYLAFIIGLDAIATIPFAKLRKEGKPLKYALIKFFNIVITVTLTLYFVGLCPWLQVHHPDSIFLKIYNPEISQVGYAILSNLIASLVTLLMLYKELGQFRLKFNTILWKEMMVYSLPLVVVGLAGMVNETLDRTLLSKLLPYDTETNKSMIGVYSAGYKIAALINIFIQIFRMGAEPFFFNEANKSDAPKVYAKVMYFFTIICLAVFLVVVLFADTIWIRYLVDSRRNPEYLAGLPVIPLLAFGYVCLGIYYNLTIWYKLTNKTLLGSYVTVIGAVITIVLNVWLIPKIGFVGSAWATLVCYLVMTIITYFMGQRYYFVPYNVKAIGSYILLALAIYAAYYWGTAQLSELLKVACGVAGLVIYTGMVWMRERAGFINLIKRRG